MSITIPIIKNITLTVGETRVLRAIISPPNATNRNVSWCSDNEAVATVERGVVTHNATRALVTAKSPGTATITARIMDYRIREDNYIVNHEYTDTCTVTVVPNVKIYLSPESMDKGPGAGKYGMERDRMETLADELHSYLQSQGYNSTIGFRDFEEGRDWNKQVADVTTYRINPSNEGYFDLHIALHSNSSDSILAVGPETYYSLTIQSDKSRVLSEKIQNSLFALYKESFPNAINRWGNHNPQFAELTDVKAVASYVEVAFHSNESDALWIINNMRKIAKAIGSGIIKYIENTY